MSYLDVDRMEVVRFPVKIVAHGDGHGHGYRVDQSASDSDSSASCGGCLLVFAVPMLIWLLVSIWNPINHNPGGIGAAALFLVVASSCIALGVRLIISARQRKGSDKNHTRRSGAEGGSHSPHNE